MARNYDAMFGNQRRRAIAQRLIDNDLWEDDPADAGPAINAAATPEAADLELELVQLYRDALRSVDPAMAVKLIGLHFPRSARTMMYLYLTTHDADGALEMNRLLWEAGICVLIRQSLTSVPTKGEGHAMGPDDRTRLSPAWVPGALAPMDHRAPCVSDLHLAGDRDLRVGYVSSAGDRHQPSAVGKHGSPDDVIALVVRWYAHDLGRSAGAPPATQPVCRPRDPAAHSHPTEPRALLPH